MERGVLLTLAGAEDGDTGKSISTVTALGGSGELLEVVDDELATGGLYDPPAGGGRVVRRALAEGDTLGHSDVSWVLGFRCILESTTTAITTTTPSKS